MPRRDTNDNHYNRQPPNNTEIVYVHVETIMGPKVESFLIEDKADIIAAKAKKPTRTRKEMQQADKPEQAWTADWPVCKYTKTAYTKSGTNREEVVADVTAKIRRMVIAWHLREYFELQAAQKSLREMREHP
jgi:KaiC/GvpD/RAD55 family RecA-like ATPase